MPTQDEYNVAKQNYRKLYCKIQLLDFDLNVLSELKGTVIEEPSFNIDSTSDIRRTCDISIYPIDKSFDIAKGNKIWIDKLIKIYIGIENNINKEVVYTNMGIYLINSPQTTYSSTENIMHINGIDLMSRFTGERNGYLKGMTYIIPSGTNVRSAIINTLELGGYNISDEKYIKYIMECPISKGYTPNDIQIDSGGTIYDILTELKNIYPNSQMYFDVDGIFHYEKIPNGENEDIFVRDDLWKNLLISYTKETSFSELKNIIEVYGGTYDINNFASDVSIKDNTYLLDVPSLKEDDYILNNTLIGFVAPKRVQNNEIKIKLNNGDEKDLLEEFYNKKKDKIDLINPTLSEEENSYYVIRAKCNEDYYTIKETNLEPKYEATVSQNTFYIDDENIKEIKDGDKFVFRTPKEGCEFAFNPYLNIKLNKQYKIEIYSSEMKEFAELSKERRDVYLSSVQKRKENFPESNYVGNVDINNRPIVIIDLEEEIYATTETMLQERWYGNEENGHYRIIHLTPILKNGTILDEKKINNYMDILFKQDDIMAYDLNNYGIVYKVDETYNGELINDDNIDMAISEADKWDVEMHNTQDKIYREEAMNLIYLKKSDLQIENYKNEISKTRDVLESKLKYYNTLDDNVINVITKEEEDVVSNKEYVFCLPDNMSMINAVSLTFNGKNNKKLIGGENCYPNAIYKLIYYDGWGEDIGAYELKEIDENQVNTLENNKVYEAIYNKADNEIEYFEFMGGINPSYISYENNPISPFFVKADIESKYTDFSYQGISSDGKDCYDLTIKDDFPINNLSVIKDYLENGSIEFKYNYNESFDSAIIDVYYKNELIKEYDVNTEEIIYNGDNLFLYNESNTVYKNNSPSEKIRIVLSGGEYDNIYSTFLAKERAKYELYLRCRLNDNVTLNCVPIYWLDVNKLVEITLPNKNGIEETNLYIITRISTNFSVDGTQSITMMRYYPTEGI